MYETPYHTEDLGQYSFLVTGGAGFIGSNLVEYLLKYGAKKVRVLDNFSTGSHQNIEEFKGNHTFELIEGDIRDLEMRSEEHTYEIKSLMRTSYVVLCLKKKKIQS